MQQRLLQLAGVLVFGIILGFTHHAGRWINSYIRDTFDFNGALVYSIPLFFLVALGAVLLRIDIVWNILKTKNIRFRLSTFLIYSWPFIIFVVILPLITWAFPNDLTAQLMSNHLNWFGRHSAIAESILFGIGILAALESCND